VEFDESVEFSVSGDNGCQIQLVGYVHPRLHDCCLEKDCHTNHVSCPASNVKISTNDTTTSSKGKSKEKEAGAELFALSDQLKSMQPLGAQLRETTDTACATGSVTNKDDVPNANEMKSLPLKNKRKPTPNESAHSDKKLKVTAGSASPSEKVDVTLSRETENGESAKKSKKRKSQEVPDVGIKRQLMGGVKYEVVKSGSGPIAQNGQKVRVKYEGRLAKTGKKFDSGAVEFNLGAGEMISGFDIGVKGMLKNEERQLFIPSRMGYGSQRTGAIPPNSDLIFTMKLLDIKANANKKRQSV